MSWRTLHVGELVDAGAADIQTGPFGTQLKASDYVSDGIPVINVRNIGYGGLKNEKLEFVTEQTAERLASHLLEPCDIVFGRKGAVDRHLYVGTEQDHWLQGSDCIRLRFLTKDVISRFVSYAFLSETHKKWMLAQAGNKATMASLNHDIIRRITLRLPTPAVQKTTVGLLSAYDDLIENNRRRMVLLEEAARQLYREWFVQLRFPGHEHTRITNGVPEGWEHTPFETALVLQRGFDLPGQDREDGDVPIYGSTGINGFHSKARVAGPGVVTGRSGTLGEVYYVPHDFWPLNTSLWVKEFKRVGPLFAVFMMKELDLRQYNGGVSVPTLDRKTVHRAEILIPTKRLLASFEDFAESLFQQINTLADQAKKLRAARNLLLPRLMNGEITV